MIPFPRSSRSHLFAFHQLDIRFELDTQLTGIYEMPSGSQSSQSQTQYSQTSPAKSSQTKIQHQGGRNENGQVVCKHDLPAKDFVIKAEGNPNKGKVRCSARKYTVTALMTVHSNSTGVHFKETLTANTGAWPKRCNLSVLALHRNPSSLRLHRPRSYHQPVSSLRHPSRPSPSSSLKKLLQHLDRKRLHRRTISTMPILMKPSLLLLVRRRREGKSQTCLTR